MHTPTSLDPGSAARLSRRALLGASGALALAACTPGADEPGGQSSAPAVSQEQIDQAMNTETTLTFWTWVPDITKEVSLFTKKYPKIKVDTVNVGQGAPHYQKLRTAIQAGQGAPDVAQVEYQYLPSFTLGNNLLDLGPYGASGLQSEYPEWVWSQITRGSAVYGIPQDVGPMGLLYRNDLFEQAGLGELATWDDFAAAADTYRSKNPKGYLTNMAPSQAGQMLGYLWQAGVRPFAFDGQETVTINLTGDDAKKVLSFWGDLVTSGALTVETDFTDSWYQGLANGKWACWPTAAWGPVFLQGTAAKTSGKWRATTLPQWQAGQNVSANWGGSTDAVLASTKNPIVAAQFAIWLNTATESAIELATEQFLFPAGQKILADPRFADQKSAFYGGQTVNKTFAEINDTVSKDFGWLPFTDYVYSQFTETVGKAFTDKTDVVAGLGAWQDALVAYAKQQGFKVA